MIADEKNNSTQGEQKIPREKPFVPLKLLYGYFDGNGIKHSKGDIIRLPLDEAKKLLSNNKAERADPLPGEIL